MNDITPILEELAAGRIDAAEANRRIEALRAASSAETSTDVPVEAEVVEEPPAATDEASSEPQDDAKDAPTGAETASGEAPRRAAREGWEGGRPQFATHTRDFFRRAASGVQGAAARAKASASSSTHPSSDADALGAAKGIERVVVRATGQRVRVIADDQVATLVAEGPHSLRRTGAVLEVTGQGELGPTLKGFSVVRPPKSLDDLRTIGLGRELVVKVNPRFVVDAEVVGGSLKVLGVPVLGRVRVTAGGATLTGVHEISDALVQAGSAMVSGPIQQGRSRVRVESGNLTVRLAHDSNVTVKAETRLGGVSWPMEGHLDEYVIGNGSARLDLAALMGRIAVRQGDDPATDEDPAGEHSEDDRTPQA